MNWPTIDDLTEARRVLAVAAAALFLVALALPMWTINVHAVQYPDQVLRLHVYAYPHMTGDYVEMHRLNKYIGFYYPDPVYWTPNYPVQPTAVDVPEWTVGPLAFVVTALLSLFVAVAPTADKLKRGLKYQLVATVGVFTVMLADIQYRLYQAGHTLDPNAPVMGVEGFTPPIWGRYEVANITSYSRLGVGAYLSMIAIGLLVLAYHYRHVDDPVWDLPALVRGDVNGVRNRLGALSGDDDRNRAT
ncbi:MAG: hypothetical protein ABEJ90_03655 [Halobacterium sp.]